MFSPEIQCFYNLCIIKGACHIIHVCIKRMRTFGQSGNTSIKVFTCLYISIKIDVNTIMLAAISLITIFPKSHYNHMKRVQVNTLNESLLMCLSC